MTPEDRKALGRHGLTQAECAEVVCTMAERELQEQIANYLRQRDLFFMRSRMDKRTTLRKGWPDFTIILHGGLALLVEVKVQGGRFSEDQTKLFQEYFRQTGELVYAVYSFDQFRSLLDCKLPTVNPS